MRAVRTIVFVFVPIYLEIVRIRTPDQAVVVSSRDRPKRWEEQSETGEKVRKNLRRWRRANRSRFDEPPFWTWFVDNPRPSSPRRY